MTGGLVVVENVDEALKSTYGPQMRISLEKALAGQKRGKWRILPGQLNAPFFHGTGGGSDYLKRDGFVTGTGGGR